jgi:hypothetical protein
MHQNTQQPKTRLSIKWRISSPLFPLGDEQEKKGKREGEYFGLPHGCLVWA